MMKDEKQGAAYWIEHLQMTPHPEGGYFKEEYRSKKIVSTKGSVVEKSAMTVIYYLLENDDFSAFHRIKSPESWFFHKGSALLIYSFEAGQLVCRELSDGVDGVLQITIDPGTWFAARLKQPDTFALVSCAVAPGFEYDEFELAKRSELLAEYPDFATTIKELTR
jgi:predicted cupin superfamily sugar epimerase